MKNEKIMTALQLEKHELTSLDRMAKRADLNRSDLMRSLMFQQLDEDNADWLIPLAKKKGVALWQYVNIILRTFKERALQADADKNLVFEGS